MKRILFILVAIFVFVAAVEASDEPETVYWEDLLPEGELERLEELYSQQGASAFGHSGYGDPTMSMQPVQIGTFNVVEELEGKLVRVPGFVLQFEYSSSGKISEFLLVPYFGACIHTPPPPPNQMVYVKTEEPTDLGQQWNPIWAIGILRTQKHYNDLGDAAYTLELQRWEQYDG